MKSNVWVTSVWGLWASSNLQMVVLARSSHHIPLATRLLGHPVAAETAAHLVVRVLRNVFRQVAGALAPSDHGDHPGVPWCCLGRGSCGGPRDHEVAWRGGGRAGGKAESREGQDGEAAPIHAGVVVQPVKGTVGVEVFHGAVDGFVH